jgi:tetratricopeptide (TPR) repeat protein
VSKPSLQEGPEALKFAEIDVEHLQTKFPNYKVVVFKGDGAKSPTILQCLDDVTSQARLKIAIFISARGYSNEKHQGDGFVVTWEAAIDKLQDGFVRNGLSLKAMAKLLGREQIKATEKYLLLDLWREPKESGIPNLINNAITEVLSETTSRIILASKSRHGSGEADNGGYYANGLQNVLTPHDDLTTLFRRLTKETRPKQIPGQPPAIKEAEWKTSLISSSLRHAPGPLIASLVPSFYLQDPTPPTRDRDTIDKAVAAEEAGQEIFIRYGEGNHFQGDPFHQCETRDPRLKDFRLCREEYQSAASNFAHAAQLRRSLPDSDPDLIKSLEERARFCQAQIHLLEGSPDLAQDVLGDPAGLHFAESHNILGIAYLERAKYLEAEKQFTRAKNKAPHWAYPRHNLALSYIEQGNFTAAEKEYREAIRVTPVAGKFAQKKQDEKNREDENPCFRGRQVTVGARPYLYYNLGVLLQQLNRLSEAQQQYCLAEASFHYRRDKLDTDPQGLDMLRREAAKINLADVNNALGVLFEARNKIEKAEDQFKKALRNNCALSAANFNLAQMGATRVKDPAKAQEIHQILTDPCHEPDIKTVTGGTPNELYQAVIAGPACNGSTTKDLGCQAARSALAELPQVAEHK